MKQPVTIGDEKYVHSQNGWVEEKTGIIANKALQSLIDVIHEGKLSLNWGTPPHPHIQDESAVRVREQNAAEEKTEKEPEEAATAITIAGQKFVYNKKKGWIDAKTKKHASKELIPLIEKATGTKNQPTELLQDRGVEPVLIGDTKYTFDIENKHWVMSPGDRKAPDSIQKLLQRFVTTKAIAEMSETIPAAAKIVKSEDESVIDKKKPIRVKRENKNWSSKSSSLLVKAISKLELINETIAKDIDNQYEIEKDRGSDARESFIEKVSASSKGLFTSKKLEGGGEEESQIGLMTVALGALAVALFPLANAIVGFFDELKGKTYSPEDYTKPQVLSKYVVKPIEQKAPTEQSKPQVLSKYVVKPTEQKTPAEQSKPVTKAPKKAPAKPATKAPVKSPTPAPKTQSKPATKAPKRAPAKPATKVTTNRTPVQVHSDAEKWGIKDKTKTEPEKVKEQPEGGPPRGNIRALKKWLEKKGLGASLDLNRNDSKSSHPDGKALDVNAPGGIVEANSPRWNKEFDNLADELTAAGYNVLWKVDKHHNHLHVQTGTKGANPRSYWKGGGGGKFSSPPGGPSTESVDSEYIPNIIDPLKKLAGIIGGLAKTDSEYMGTLAEIASGKVNKIGEYSAKRYADAVDRTVEKDIKKEIALDMPNINKRGGTIQTPPSSNDRSVVSDYLLYFGFKPSQRIDI